jgi:DNA-binding NarL/FixJ family response regulator
MPQRILIVDDHPSFRATARLLLESEGFEVVGEAPDGHEALRLAAELRPAVVLLDVNLPDLDGFEVARRLAAYPARPVVVMTSSRDGSDFGTLVAASGAAGFVAKSDLSGEAIDGLLGEAA